MDIDNFDPVVADCVLSLLEKCNSGITKDQFYHLNIVDSTDVTEDDMNEVNDEVIHFCRDNGCYAALPPFEEGAFIDRSERRYTHWKVLEVSEDYFRIEFNHFPIIFIDDGGYSSKIEQGRSAEISHPCWYQTCKTIVKVKLLTSEEHIEALSRHPDFRHFDNLPNMDKPKLLQKLSEFLKTNAHVGGVIESYEYYMPHDLKKIVKKGKYSSPDGRIVDGGKVREIVTDTFENAMDSGLNSILFCSTCPIIEMFTYVNYVLSHKSATGSSTLRHVSSIYNPDDGAADVRKERHFGKVKVVSEKKPRSVTKENIQRVYTTLSWQRRSHVRHLADGRIIPVKSAVCKRHNVDEADVPQVIYKV